MPINFPTGPTLNQTYTDNSSGANKTWKWNGTAWATQTLAATINPLRTTNIASSTTITANSDTTDLLNQINTQATGTLTIAAPTGSPVDGQRLTLRISSTNVQTFSWNAIFGGSTDMALPTTTTGANKEDYIGFIYDSVSVKWHLVAKSFGY
jgi:hypothetical protein